MKLRLRERIWDLDIIASRLTRGAPEPWERRLTGSLLMFMLEALVFIPVVLLVMVVLGMNAVRVVEAPRWVSPVVGAVFIALNHLVFFRKADWEAHWERWAQMAPGERRARMLVSAALLAALFIVYSVGIPALRKRIYPG